MVLVLRGADELKLALLFQDTLARVRTHNQKIRAAATRIADLLRGKNRPDFTPHVDNGSFVVVINASKVRFTGKKLKEKNYYHHTGYPGGMKSISAERQLEKHPDRIIRDAVWGMMPKNTSLSKRLMTKLKVYPGAEHPHAAQNPQTLEL